MEKLKLLEVVTSQNVFPELHSFLEEVSPHAQLPVNAEVDVLGLGGPVPRDAQQTVPLWGGVPAMARNVSAHRREK